MFKNIYRYQRFEDFKTTLQEITGAYPELIKLEKIGTSFRGREVFLVTVTDFSRGREEDKSAFYADACTHAEEFSGCNALLSLIKQLAEGFTKNENIRNLLSYRFLSHSEAQSGRNRVRHGRTSLVRKRKVSARRITAPGRFLLGGSR
ncbi:MAG: hypothetical protein IJL16_02120 [Clostridia bacterium]|nr:hypothetical protein [Clostridia bacterium]